MRKYEIMYIIRPTVEEDSRKALVENFNKVLTDNNAEVEVKDWGMRSLAYEIDDLRKGHYILLNVKANTEAIDEFDRLARINEDIIRYIVVKDE
ncbi:30S ribosomal protein S6 [Haloplasma contractile]|uniref:Small ribosomal subunit protein bS6 n=1 Tax=Haloplasma contractile SSD-17B TaxID=1033810 RepID=U2FQN6_9MOLU|nr:30S ribosomal protein S6 [Haloplasma contractile]ERJ13344.1 30S ribosomal protein S6 [Haloplasma contractile SSD-17B]